MTQLAALFTGLPASFCVLLKVKSFSTLLSVLGDLVLQHLDESLCAQTNLRAPANLCIKMLQWIFRQVYGVNDAVLNLLLSYLTQYIKVNLE